ncbi:MAG: imidazolonepropionase-like domain-containing protein, partial [Candidatus Hadarchaeum sp.]
MAEKILIDNGIVVTMNPRREVLRDASVLVEGDRIAAVGPAAEVRREH